MKTLYSIFDSVGGFYCPIFQAENNGHAIRMFSEAFENRKHLADYTLWELGTFDPDNGEMITHKQPKMVLNGLSLNKETEQ